MLMDNMIPRDYIYSLERLKHKIDVQIIVMYRNII